MLKEQPYDFRIAVIRRIVERRHVSAIFGMNVRAVLQKDSDDLKVSVRGGNVQRRVSLFVLP